MTKTRNTYLYYSIIGLLSELFGELYDGYVIQKESLCKWRDSKDQSAGKGESLLYKFNLYNLYDLLLVVYFVVGVAVKSLNPFFNSLFSEEAN